jgi:hypothetical protein
MHSDHEPARLLPHQQQPMPCFPRRRQYVGIRLAYAYSNPSGTSEDTLFPRALICRYLLNGNEWVCGGTHYFIGSSSGRIN